jgi:predicted ATPase
MTFEEVLNQALAMLQRQGKTEYACQLLTGVYVWFTEGFDMANLQEAQALLEQLA